jgi:hypothetical protein
MRSFKEYCELRPLFEDNSLPTSGFFAEFVEARDNEVPLNEFFGLGKMFDRFRSGRRVAIPYMRLVTDPATGKRVYKTFQAGEFMPDKLPGQGKPDARSSAPSPSRPTAPPKPAKPAGRYTDKPAEDLEVIEQPVKIKPEKLIQFIKSSGVDVSKLSPKTIQTFTDRLNTLPTRDAAMNQIRDTIRQMLQAQGKYNTSGAIA